MDEEITSVVPVIPEGEAAGIKKGGQLEQVIMELEVKSLPANMPESITVDVSALDMNEAIHVKDLVMPEGVVPLIDESLIVFHVRAPRTEEPEETAAEGETEAPAETEGAESK